MVVSEPSGCIMAVWFIYSYNNLNANTKPVDLCTYTGQAGVYNATHLGPPAGLAPEFYGWTVYDDKLWFNAAKPESEGFFTGNVTEHIEYVNSLWISWFGGLDTGRINYACITDETKNAEKYCDAFGQPYAPAAQMDDEIYSVIDETKIDENILRRRAM